MAELELTLSERTPSEGTDSTSVAGIPGSEVTVQAPVDATAEEVAAALAAVQSLWPRGGAAVAPAPPMRWRFSGRWWAKPVPLGRDRP